MNTITMLAELCSLQRKHEVALVHQTKCDLHFQLRDRTKIAIYAQFLRPAHMQLTLQLMPYNSAKKHG